MTTPSTVINSKSTCSRLSGRTLTETTTKRRLRCCKQCRNSIVLSRTKKLRMIWPAWKECSNCTALVHLKLIWNCVVPNMPPLWLPLQLKKLVPQKSKLIPATDPKPLSLSLWLNHSKPKKTSIASPLHPARRNLSRALNNSQPWWLKKSSLLLCMTTTMTCYNTTPNSEKLTPEQVLKDKLELTTTPSSRTTWHHSASRIDLSTRASWIPLRTTVSRMGLSSETTRWLEVACLISSLRKTSSSVYVFINSSLLKVRS